MGEDAASIEAWLGQRGLGWAACLLLLFAVAFFLKYAFDNEWIGPTGQVAAGVAVAGGHSVLADSIIIAKAGGSSARS